MKLPRSITVALLGAAVATTMAAPLASAATAPIPYSTVDGETGSVLHLLEADGSRLDPRTNVNWSDYDILERVARIVVEAKPGTPVAGLASASNSWTVFAPSDRAFRILAHELTGTWYHTEGQVIRAIATTVSTVFGADELINTLENVLLYHVVTARATYADAKALAIAETPITTALGSDLRPRYAANVDRVILRDADTSDRNAWVTKRNIEAKDSKDGSIVHGVNLVLRPVDLP